MRFTIAAVVMGAAGSVAASAAACDAPLVGEAEIRVAALIHLAEQGVDAPVSPEALIQALSSRLPTCETAVERQLIENRITVLAHKVEGGGLKARGHADYDPETNSWRLTDAGAAEVATWRRYLSAAPAD